MGIFINRGRDGLVAIAATGLFAVLIAPAISVQAYRAAPLSMLGGTEATARGIADAIPNAGPVSLSSRAYNLCARYDGVTLWAYKCTGGQADETWLVFDTGTAGRYPLKNVATGLCLTSSGTTLSMVACEPGSSTNWWTFAVVSDQITISTR